MKSIVTFFIFLLLCVTDGIAQHSVARQWNEVMLDAIRNDQGRPTVHSRNLFHVSAVMYDAWAAYDDEASTFMLGHQVGDYIFEFEGVDIPADETALLNARNEAVSYAAYRLLKHRFSNSIGAVVIIPQIDSLMLALGYDTSFISTDYKSGIPAALGNYLGIGCMEFGIIDHSDEEFDYEYDDAFYQAINPGLAPELPGNPNIVDLNHWQPLILANGPPRRFLSPQWGLTTPFSLNAQDLEIYEKLGNNYYIYHDPGTPPFIDTTGSTMGLEDYYKWNFALVALWSGQLDPKDSILIDISPASVGNLPSLPSNEEEMRSFYDFFEGGVHDTGYTINPVTGLAYEPQMVPRGDFGRVIAEFWADGPKSETPPGHWFTLLNYVNDHPLFEKRFEGTGEILDDLEWDVKSYLILGGAMHDVAVAVWGIKSYYDYVRPISAIRGMAELGQSSDTSLMSYHPGGLPLIEGHIELVESGDPLAGDMDENVGKIKLYAWRGPAHIGADGNAGVGWILADNWWPYQRPSFVTPPFAGYVSGHSTFSRAAAEVLTLLTGDPYFPGGMGVFDAAKNDYLVFEVGPSEDMQLQWATYRDASDQASLSRLWGGIHPPVDDIPGRNIGKIVGPEAFEFAKTFFSGATTATKHRGEVNNVGVIRNYPNPVSDYTSFEYSVRVAGKIHINIYDLNGRLVHSINEGQRNPGAYVAEWKNAGEVLRSGFYLYRLESAGKMSAPQKLMSLGK